jgi:diguanylate cyclase (GGDEF)-like protein
VTEAEDLSAALQEIEDQYDWNTPEAMSRAVALERRAHQLGDELLIHRARLCQANMQMRSGDLAGAASRVWEVQEWAVAHEARPLTARAHLIWAYLHRLLGDGAQCLEHAVLAVEFLDDTATPHMQIWHRAKLADALSMAGSMDAARQRYQQAADLAAGFQRADLLLALLNNWAYSEFCTGHHDQAREIAGRLERQAGALGVELAPPALETIGAIEIENGLFADAVRTMELCIQRYGDGRLSNANALAEYTLTLARAQRGLADHALAQTSLDRSREMATERGLDEVLVRVCQEQAELHAARGEFERAFALYKEFFTAHNELHSTQREARARTRQAMFEIAEARAEAENYREQARRDPLTGLRNRRYVDETLPQLIDAHHELTVAIVDLDHFKRINDELSHEVGDQVLVRVAAMLQSKLADVSSEGFAARIGGEEFVLVLPGVSPASAIGPIDGIRQDISAHDWRPVARHRPVSVSIGIAGPDDVSEPTQLQLLAAADRNLYAAKRNGRDQVVHHVSAAPQWAVI